MSQEPLSEVPVEELLRRAREGDRLALEELFRRCQPLLDRWAAQSGVQPPAGVRPSDIAQEAALRAFDKFATFQGSTQAEWFSWLQRVLLSQAAQLGRDAHRKKRQPSEQESLEESPEAQAVAAPQPSPSQATAHQEELRSLMGHLFHLPEDQRDALVLYHLRGLTVAELARRLERSETAVESLLQRGMRALRARMRGVDSAAEARVDPAVEEAMSALQKYRRRRDAGEQVDLAAFIAEHPECAEELRSLLHWIQRLQSIPLPESSS